MVPLNGHCGTCVGRDIATPIGPCPALGPASAVGSGGRIRFEGGLWVGRGGPLYGFCGGGAGISGGSPASILSLALLTEPPPPPPGDLLGGTHS